MKAATMFWTGGGKVRVEAEELVGDTETEDGEMKNVLIEIPSFF